MYEAWKEMTNNLIRGYSSFGIEAWTVPCLYVAGKYMRVFAIKADEETGNGTRSMTSFQDDFNPEAEKNEKLEDAARVLNRIFQLCLSDRYAKHNVMDSVLLISLQSTIGGVEEVGHIQHHQSLVQDLLQIELHQLVQEYSQSYPGVPRRYA